MRDEKEEVYAHLKRVVPSRDQKGKALSKPGPNSPENKASMRAVDQEQGGGRAQTCEKNWRLPFSF